MTTQTQEGTVTAVRKSVFALMAEVDLSSRQTNFGAIEAGETLLGVATEDLQRLYWLAEDLRKKALELAEKNGQEIRELEAAFGRLRLSGTATSKDVEMHRKQTGAFKMEIYRAVNLAVAAREMFQNAIRLEFADVKLEDITPTLRFRDGWQMVTAPGYHHIHLADFMDLADILGFSGPMAEA